MLLFLASREVCKVGLNATQTVSDAHVSEVYRIHIPYTVYECLHTRHQTFCIPRGGKTYLRSSDQHGGGVNAYAAYRQCLILYLSLSRRQTLLYHW